MVRGMKETDWLKSVLLVFLTLQITNVASAEPRPPNDDETLATYRALSLKVRAKGDFRIAMPSNGDMAFSYELKFGAPKFERPLFADFFLDAENTRLTRMFWDKVYLEDGSYLKLGGENIPLTCVFVKGQDNRFSRNESPLIPDFVLKIYLVANDFTCTGPINPGWPGNGGKKELWDTYFYFEVRDPTIMLPAEAKVRYRWSEFPAFLVDQGGVR
jgi:hypothetical protein